VPRNRSAREVFVANLGSPVMRFRSGVMQGPRFADKVMPVEVPLIAVSIDGSVTIIEELHPTLTASLRWLEEKLTFPGSPLLVPGISPDHRFLLYSSLCGRVLMEGHLSSRNVNCLNVDRLLFYADRVISGTAKVNTSAMPRAALRLLKPRGGEDVAVDPVTRVRTLLDGIFPGISL
jgi:hypothetical protein